MVRSEDWAEPSFAARREARRLGIAMAAMMPIIATTMSSSISEKPFWFLFIMSFICSLRDKLVFCLRATGFVSSNDRSARFFLGTNIKPRAKTVRDLYGLKNNKSEGFLP